MIFLGLKENSYVLTFVATIASFSMVAGECLAIRENGILGRLVKSLIIKENSIYITTLWSSYEFPLREFSYVIQQSVWFKKRRIWPIFFLDVLPVDGRRYPSKELGCINLIANGKSFYWVSSDLSPAIRFIDFFQLRKVS